jgi:hypothetical protein
VTFDLRETTSWRGDYTPIPSKLSGGHEVVRVIEDTGRHIALQHLLVVKDESGKTMVIKHWRQDWNYEPENLLTYAGKGEWKLETIPATMRAGRWSQTVWQTDDSPLWRMGPMERRGRGTPLAFKLDAAPAGPARCGAPSGL